LHARLLWPLLIALGLALVLLALRGENDVLGLASQDFARLVALGAWSVAVGSMMIVAFRNRFSQAMRAAALWIVLAAVLALAYTYRSELREVAERMIAELIPGTPVQIGRAVEIARGRSGEFRVAARVNGSSVPMVLDTGASSIVLTHETAKAIGLPLEVLSYSVKIETANGRARAASVMLDRVAVGTIVERSVPALVAQAGQLHVNLLGMSFLDRLESWQVRGDRLTMRGYR
jgi:aspartyl protease family protein